MGKKKLPPDEFRGNVLRIRLTDAERALLDRAAKGSTSTWARIVLLKRARKKRRA